MSEHCRPCDPLNCDPPDDLGVYSLDGIPTPVPPPVPPTPPADFGNDAVTYCCDCAEPEPPVIPTCPDISLSPATLPDAEPGVAYSELISASGGAGPYDFTVTSGALPTGLSLASDGTISGTPSAASTFNFVVRATDYADCTGTRAYSIAVVCPTITLSPTTLPDGEVGTAYNQTITAAGGTGPYTFAVISGALPDGLSLAAGGALTGTPTVESLFTFEVEATDNYGCTGTRSYDLNIAAAPPAGMDANDDMESYTDLAAVNGLNGGSGFSGAYVDR